MKLFTKFSLVPSRSFGNPLWIEIANNDLRYKLVYDYIVRSAKNKRVIKHKSNNVIALRTSANKFSGKQVLLINYNTTQNPQRCRWWLKDEGITKQTSENNEIISCKTRL